MPIDGDQSRQILVHWEVQAHDIGEMPCSLSIVHQAHIVSRGFREVASQLLAPPCPHEGVCLFKGIGAELALQIGTVGHLAVLYDALTTELEIARKSEILPQTYRAAILDLGLTAIVH